MTIQNCRITKVTTDFWWNDNQTKITIKTVSDKGQNEKSFLTDRSLFAIKQICKYADVQNAQALQGKIIREVCSRDNEVIGYGDPIEDDFFLFNRKGLTFHEADLDGMNL